MAAAATPRQLQYLAYIHAYSVLHGQPPSEAEIAAYFNVSPPAAHQIVVTLERRGLIGRTPGQARSIRVLLSPAAIPGLHGGRTLPQAEPAAGVAYPHLARWIAGAGVVELGRTEHGGSMARALQDSAIVWEGWDSYPSLDELLQDVERGIARWREEHG